MLIWETVIIDFTFLLAPYFHEIHILSLVINLFNDMSSLCSFRGILQFNIDPKHDVGKHNSIYEKFWGSLNCKYLCKFY